VGTPHYMSPEQAQGRPNLDGRSDIYSLGATLYQLVTGRTPFQGSANEVMTAQITKQIPNPQDLHPDISDAVVMVIKKMMAKAPEDRYRNCDDLVEDIARVLEGKMPEAAEIDSTKSSVAMRAVGSARTEDKAEKKERSEHSTRTAAEIARAANKRKRTTVTYSKGTLYLLMIAVGIAALCAIYAFTYYQEVQRRADTPVTPDRKP